MAFRSNGPITLSLPAFRGVTRRIVLIAVAAYFAGLLLQLMPNAYLWFVMLFTLHPELTLPKELWALVSYPFVGGGLLSVLFGCLSVWFFGSTLEDERGRRWMGEYFLVTTIVGGLLACLLGFASHDRVIPGIGVEELAAGLWPFALSLVFAFAVFHPEQEVVFYFVLRLKAKYLAAIYGLVYLALTLIGGDRFGALVVLCNAGAGYAFLRLAPRHGVRVGVSEWWFGLRNGYYRWKRRRAAKKFTVYMKKQGKEVSLDDEGRYIDPNGKARDLNDRNWMN
jgi:membrane associated rhomboid family serine protease